MRNREYYYVQRRYDSAGLDPFLEHVAEFLAGTRTVPVAKAPSLSHDACFFTFSSSLFRMFLEDTERMRKPYEVALKYGFRGYSRGGRNGVFRLRQADAGLASALPALVRQNQNEISEDLDCALADVALLKGVKIVYHEPSGERVVGVMNQANGRVIFLGFASY